MTDADCYSVRASRILYASRGARCSYHPNPKRPTWRCKLPPTWMLMRTDVENMGAVYCDEHKVTVTTGCPE